MVHIFLFRQLPSALLLRDLLETTEQTTKQVLTHLEIPYVPIIDSIPFYFNFIGCVQVFVCLVPTALPFIFVIPGAV